MRTVIVQAPSFPVAASECELALQPSQVWQVLCGDEQHWRVGIYSPSATSRAQLLEFERHSCPELFCLLEGQLTLVVLDDGRMKEIPLRIGVPVLVEKPHNGYCPTGPHGGKALVVERDRFETTYRSPAQWYDEQSS